MLPNNKVLIAHGDSHGSSEPQPEKSLTPLAEPTIVPDSSSLTTTTVENINSKPGSNDWPLSFGLGEAALLLLVLCPLSLFTLKGQLHRRKK